MKKVTHLLSLAALLATVLVARGAITDGLVSYWPMDATNGTTTPDLSFANTMTFSGPAVVVANTNLSGQFSNAMQFNGTSTYLTNVHTGSPDNTGLPAFRIGAAYTVAMWVKGPAQTAKYLFAEASSGNANPLFIIQTGAVAANNSKLDVILRGAVTLVNHPASTNVVFDNNWHHIAWVDNQGSVRLYIDGNPDPANFSYDGKYTDLDRTLDITAIGTLVRSNNSASFSTNQPAVATGNIFNGQIDELATWERALSQDEVNQVRTNGVYPQGTPVPARSPTLAKQPADAVKRMGDWHLFSVEPGGNHPFTYQWNKNGIPIPDATNRTYQTPTGLQTNNTGDYYSVNVTNPVGTATSTNATLTVLDDPAPDTTNGLVNYWPLDGVTETTNAPELHFGHNFQMFGMNTNFDIVPGQYGNSFTFFAAPAPGTFGNRIVGTPIYSRTNYTVSLWVNSALLQADRRVFSEGRNGAGTNNNPLFTLGTDNTGTTPSVTALLRSDANVNSAMTGRKSTRPVFDGAWHHLVWTDANGQGKLYVDGVLDETDYTYTRPAVTLDLTMIGVTARGNTTFGLAPFNPYTGNIDEVATWSRVLTWSEIQQIMTNGVPIPVKVVLAPIITTQPPQRTNNVFAGDTVPFPVVVNGTPPFDFRWWKGTTPVSGALSPSALTDTLILTNVQSADSNTTYFVVVTNTSGSVTSTVARLYVSPVMFVTNGEVLRVDAGLTGQPNPQPGFTEFTLGNNPASFAGAVRLTFSGIDTVLADRNRTAVPWVTNNPPALTQAQIYNDFIFANDASFVDGRGMRILIERLAPNAAYGLTIWSFDPVSAPERMSTWTETASGTSVAITNGVAVTNGVYTFNGANLPTKDFDYTFGGLVTSSAAGQLQIDGVRRGGTSFGVFVNAIRLVANPVATGITKATVVGGNLRLTTETEYPGMAPNIEQSNSVTGPWVPAAGGTIVDSVGPVVTIDFPIDPTINLFYRGKRKP